MKIVKMKLYPFPEDICLNVFALLSYRGMHLVEDKYSVTTELNQPAASICLLKIFFLVLSGLFHATPLMVTGNILVEI